MFTLKSPKYGTQSFADYKITTILFQAVIINLFLKYHTIAATINKINIVLIVGAAS